MSEENYDDFFQQTGGAPSFKFKEIGSFVRGEVVSQFKTQQMDFADPDKGLFFKDGSPRMQINVTLQTNLRNWDGVTRIPTDGKDGPELDPSEDDGKRRIYVKAEMQKAVGAAIKAAGAPGLRTGGTLAVKLTDTKDVGKGNPANIYEAKYTPPVAGAETDDAWDNEPAPPAAASQSDEPPF